VHALAALVLAVLAPSFLLVVGPLVFGVPHLVADVRHLLLRRASMAWWLRASAVFALALIVLRALAESGVRRVPLPFEHALAAAWVLLGVVAGATARGVVQTGDATRSRRGDARVWTLLAAAGVLAAFAVAAPQTFRVVLLHAHNLLAIVIWLIVFRRRWRLVWLPMALVVVGAAALAGGVTVAITVHHGALSVFGLHLFAAADWMAPGLPDAQALAVTASFAFLQSIHYAIWLIAIPAADRPGDGGRAWRTAWRDLARDLRPAGLWVVAALALLVAVAGVVNMEPTRRLFLSLATFHAWLELAVLAYLLARGPGRL
jgi:hypothetical protein